MVDFEKKWEDGLLNGWLSFPRCDTCCSWNWYPLPICSKCQGNHFTWKEVRLLGTVYSWTKVHHDFSGGQIQQVPYVVGLIEPLDAEGVRIPCRYISANSVIPEIGTQVKLMPVVDVTECFWGFE